MLWALCSNTFSLNEAAQASLKAKFKPATVAATATPTTVKQKVAANATLSSASVAAAGVAFTKTVKSGGNLAAVAAATSVRPKPAALSNQTAVESETAVGDLRGENLLIIIMVFILFS